MKLKISMLLRKLSGCIFSLMLISGGFQQAKAGVIPYPDPGTYNNAIYSFTAATSGDIIAYFAGSGASFDNDLGLLVNGVLQGGFGLNDHTSVVGDSYNFGYVTAGSTLTFVLRNNTYNAFAYSDPSMNVAYDQPGETDHNHIYSTTYSSGQISGINVNGLYVAFEDVSFPYGDYNYSDENFVFTNVSDNSVPEPTTLLLFGFGLAGLGILKKRTLK